jgi:hypothetical protein
MAQWARKLADQFEFDYLCMRAHIQWILMSSGGALFWSLPSPDSLCIQSNAGKHLSMHEEAEQKSKSSRRHFLLLGFRTVTGLPAVFRLRFSRLRLRFLILTPAGKPYPYLRCHGTALTPSRVFNKAFHFIVSHSHTD